MCNTHTKLEDLKVEAAKVELKISARKTKQMRIKNVNTTELKLGNQGVEKVNSFCYLGSIITSRGGATEDINKRIRKDKGSFASLRQMWRFEKLKVRPSCTYKKVMCPFCSTNVRLGK